MLEIRTTLSWNKEADAEVLRGVMNQPDVTTTITPAGTWIVRGRSIIGVIYNGDHYFKPATDSPTMEGLFTGMNPPSRAQRYHGLRWHNLNNNEVKTWDGLKKEWV